MSQSEPEQAERPTGWNRDRLTRLARNLATLAALLAGGLHVASLWAVPLSRESLTEAGRGVLLILLALGLMGTARLSLILVMLLCSTALYNALQHQAAISLVSALEVALLVLSSLALLAPKPTR